MATHYEKLGVSQDATPEQIKKAFHKLSLQHHPDRPTGDEEKFKEISEAYNVLSDSEKRRQYDLQQQGHPFDFDFAGGFDQMFNDFFGPGRRASSNSSHLNLDIHSSVEITFEQLYTGVKKQIQIERKSFCSTCNGVGGKINLCTQCKGSGAVGVRNGPVIFQTQCHSCRGSGKIKDPQSKCSTCNGQGYSSETQAEQIEIYPGLGEPGSIVEVTFPHRGHSLGTFKGNLNLKIKTSPTNTFVKSQNNLVYKYKCKYTELVLGSTIEVPLPDKTFVKVTIAPGTSLTSILRVKGKGFQGVQQINTQQGDLLVSLSLDIPKNIDLNQQKILQQLKDVNL
jgi:molecular chaperone DnaJ